MGFSVIMLGAGNVGTHLARALHSSGTDIRQVYSRSEESASILARELHTAWTVRTSEILPDADVYFLTVKDDVLHPFLKSAPLENKFLVHCSGSLSLQDLMAYTSECGVLYPLQTFSRSRNVDFSEVPVFLEYSSERAGSVLKQLAAGLTGRVYLADSVQRVKLHISAVFACNFVNHLYSVAASLLKDIPLDFEVLVPLIRETMQKAGVMDPFLAQTGPAVRNDKEIIQKHMQLLASTPDLQELYRMLTEHIHNQHKRPIHGIF